MDVDLIFKIAAIGIIVAVLNQVLIRSGREEQAMMTTLAGLIVVLMMIINEINTLFETVKTIFGLGEQYIMEWIGMIGIGLVGMVIAVLLRQYKPEYAVFVSLAVGVLIIGMLCSQLLPVFNEMKEMLSQANLSLEYIGILIKSLGVCYLTQLASDACRDAGETAISSKLELAGKITVLSLGLPLFGKLLDIVKQLIAI